MTDVTDRNSAVYAQKCYYICCRLSKQLHRYSNSEDSTFSDAQKVKFFSVFMNIIWMVVSDHIKKVNLFIIQQYIYMVINIGHV